MLRRFNHNRSRIFRIVSLVWLVVFCARVFRCGASLAEFLIPYLLFSFLYIAAGSWLLSFELSRAVKGFQDRCLAAPLLSACEAMYNDLNARGRKRAFGQTLLLDRCAALLALGRAGEAEELLRAMPEPRSAVTEAVFRTHASALLLQLQRTGEAEDAISRAEEAVERVKGAMARDRLTWVVEEHRCHLALLLWQADCGTERRLLALAEGAPTHSGRVAAAFLLGWFYRGSGREREAEPHLRFAAEHGGDCAVRARAEAMLRDCVEGGTK